MPAKTPEDADRLFGEYLNAGNIDALVALYETGGSLVQSDGSLATGHAAIREALVLILEARPVIRMNVVRIAHSGDVAMLYNDWSMTVKGPDGNSIQMQGKALEVVRRQADGTWKFAIDDPYARD